MPRSVLADQRDSVKAVSHHKRDVTSARVAFLNLVDILHPAEADLKVVAAGEAEKVADVDLNRRAGGEIEFRVAHARNVVVEPCGCCKSAGTAKDGNARVEELPHSICAHGRERQATCSCPRNARHGPESSVVGVTVQSTARCSSIAEQNVPRF